MPVDIVLAEKFVAVDATSALTAPVISQLKEECRFYYREDDGAGDVVGTWVDMWSINRDGRMYLGPGYLPRVMDLFKAANIPHRVTVEVLPRERTPPAKRYDTDWAGMSAKLSLRVFQDKALATLESRDRGIVQCPPAFGKSFLFTAYALAHPKARIHIVCDKLDVLQRIHREIVQYDGHVGIVDGSKRDFRRVTLISAHSLHRVDFDDAHSRQFADVVLADEVSRLAAPSIFEKLQRYNRCKMYGFDADPYCRWDGAHGALESVFGKVIFTRTYQECVDVGLICPIEVEWETLNMVSPLAGNERRDVRYRRGIWRNATRNAMIAKKILSLPADEQCLALCTTVDHLVSLKQFLPDITLVYDEKSMSRERFDKAVEDGIFDPSRDKIVTKALRKEYAIAFARGQLNQVAANKVWDTGVSFEMLRHLYMAHGMASAQAALQGPGRASRIHDASGKEVGKVYDILDAWDTGFRNSGMARAKIYRRENWKQTGITLPRSRDKS